mgnify:CR=1 FL=1
MIIGVNIENIVERKSDITDTFTMKYRAVKIIIQEIAAVYNFLCLSVLPQGF